MKTPKVIFTDEEYNIGEPYYSWKERRSALFNTEFVRRDVMVDCIKKMVYGYTGYSIDDKSAGKVIDEAIESFNELKGVAK